ncbi:MAG: hypothetical protein PHO02_01910 [Candidatus Nanoarchaeia archaeon]|nr:hypothetical protein [Candidatus Nanoarchaeia archaeon]
MKSKAVAMGLAALIAGCASPEIKPRDDFEIKREPGITITQHFDGSYEIVKEEPYIKFHHNKPRNYDFIVINSPEINMSITDNRCDGIADMVVIRNQLGLDDMYFRFQHSQKWLFEKADKMLEEAKAELGI